jgi:hypothetical protein
MQQQLVPVQQQRVPVQQQRVHLPYADVQQSCNFSMDTPDTPQDDASMPSSKFSRGLKLLEGAARYCKH